MISPLSSLGSTSPAFVAAIQTILCCYRFFRLQTNRLPSTDFGTDPVGDLNALAAGGVLHKYDGRALVIATGACGVHCRYCFRREFPYLEAGSRSDNWRPAIDYIQEHSTIDEVILSGGDPLTLVERISGPLDHGD